MWVGAYYLAGYALECAFKAKIAQETRRFTFPDKSHAAKVHTHNLGELLKLSALETQLKAEMAANPLLEVNWSVVKDWTSEVRYSLTLAKQDAIDMHNSAFTRVHGIAHWIRKQC